MKWWQKDPDLLASVRSDVDAFTDLEVSFDGDVVVVTGIWNVFGEQQFIRYYEIKVILPDDYPLTSPTVIETGKIIPTGRHLNGDGSCCLFAPPERWEKWPLGASFADFLNGAVKEYFFSQAYFELTGEWPFGEWGHNFAGVYEYYQDRLDIKNPYTMLSIIRLRNINARNAKKMQCPCGRGNKFSDCHFIKLKHLKSFLPEFEWKNLEEILDRTLRQLEEKKIEEALSLPPNHYLRR